LNAAVSSELGIPDDKIAALADYPTSPLFSEAERAALEYADSMTITGREVPDDLFENVRRFYGEDAVVELTATIAWENCSSKFNRALRVPSQGFWKRASD
jgi:alkylhydroperoxidase family enzyme